MSTAHHGSRPIRPAVGLDHAHAFGQIEVLLNQGGQLVGFSSNHPAATVAQAARRRWPKLGWVDYWASAQQSASKMGIAQ